jgi:hypothetical protein
LRAGGEQAAVKIRNMSANGAMIETPVAPAIGREVVLLRGALAVAGTVIWNSEGRCGLRFTSDVAPKEWLAAPAVQQRRVDEVVALVKADAVTRSNELPALTEARGKARTTQQLVEDLDHLGRLLGDLEDNLSSCHHNLANHGVRLQSLDIAMQMLRAIASQLADPSEVAGGASLQDLRAACAQALGTA